MDSFLTVALSWGRKALGAIPISFYVIAFLVTLLVVADIRHARLGRELTQARTALKVFESSGLSVAHERLKAQEAERLRINSRVAEITEAHDQDIVSIAARYDRRLAVLDGVRNGPSAHGGVSPGVPSGPEAPGSAAEAEAESRFARQLRNCEEGLADLEALQRFHDTH